MVSTFPEPKSQSWFHTLLDRISGRAMVRHSLETGHVKEISLAEFIGAMVVLGFALHLAGPFSVFAGGPLADVSSGLGVIGYLIALPQLAGQVLTRLHLAMDRHRIRMFALYATTAFMGTIAAIFILAGATLGALVYLLLAAMSFSTSRRVHLYNGRDQ